MTQKHRQHHSLSTFWTIHTASPQSSLNFFTTTSHTTARLPQQHKHYLSITINKRLVPRGFHSTMQNLRVDGSSDNCLIWRRIKTRRTSNACRTNSTIMVGSACPEGHLTTARTCNTFLFALMSKKTWVRTHQARMRFLKHLTLILIGYIVSIETS